MNKAQAAPIRGEAAIHGNEQTVRRGGMKGVQHMLTLFAAVDTWEYPERPCVFGRPGDIVAKLKTDQCGVMRLLWRMGGERVQS